MKANLHGSSSPDPSSDSRTSAARRSLGPLGLALLLATLFLLLLAGGCLRYGGPEGLVMRVQAELAGQRSHPQFVPTPLPTPTGQPIVAALLSTPVPTAPMRPADLDDSPASSVTTGSVGSLEASSGQPAGTPPFTGVEVLPDLPPAATGTLAPSPVPTPTETAVPELARSQIQLTGFSHMWQTWNNCGPATLAMNLSYYGSSLNQAQVAQALKPDKNDKNVSPHEMAAFARAQGYQALVRVNGDHGRLRRLVQAGVPVLVETWLDHDGGMGHYRLVTGYDDTASSWIVYDSYVSEGVDPKQPYQGIRIPYQEMTRLWRAFNGTYVVVFDQDKAPQVAEILAEEGDDEVMWRRTLERVQAEVQQGPDDAFAWFNLGSTYVAVGQYDRAAAAFDQARIIGLPWRMFWYQFGPFLAYYETGRFQELVAVADATIATAGNIEETFYWKGRGLQALGDLEGARQAFQRAVELNANYTEAIEALASALP